MHGALGSNEVHTLTANVESKEGPLTAVANPYQLDTANQGVSRLQARARLRASAVKGFPRNPVKPTSLQRCRSSQPTAQGRGGRGGDESVRMLSE